MHYRTINAQAVWPSDRSKQLLAACKCRLHGACCWTQEASYSTYLTACCIAPISHSAVLLDNITQSVSVAKLSPPSPFSRHHFPPFNTPPPPPPPATHPSQRGGGGGGGRPRFPRHVFVINTRMSYAPLSLGFSFVHSPPPPPPTSFSVSLSVSLSLSLSLSHTHIHTHTHASFNQSHCLPSFFMHVLSPSTRANGEEARQEGRRDISRALMTPLRAVYRSKARQTNLHSLQTLPPFAFLRHPE